ncbi:MAG: alpha/beta hydrolase [Clostridia bacterium]|nr:alpha/beta hydrolase [Clostridia bacterium]
MAINKAIRVALKALSYPASMDLEKTFVAQRLFEVVKAPLSPLYKLWDHRIERDGHEIRIRIYNPQEQADMRDDKRVLLFFHGGGWVHETIDTYNNVCRALSRATGCRVASVEYSRAPEHAFPQALEDCYSAARAIYQNPDEFDIEADEIMLIGDSAGGNLAAATSLMARDRGEFVISGQILIYPATWYDHSATSPFQSVHDNGEDYLLTSKRIQEYMAWYAGDNPDCRFNPYFSPLNSTDFSNQPRTLVITAEYDPLRDEGEAYAMKLREAGNDAWYIRMPDMLHGYFALPSRFAPVRQTHDIIISFLNGDIEKWLDKTY